MTCKPRLALLRSFLPGTFKSRTTDEYNELVGVGVEDLDTDVLNCKLHGALS